MGKAHGWRTFPKCKVRFNWHHYIGLLLHDLLKDSSDDNNQSWYRWNKYKVQMYGYQLDNQKHSIWNSKLISFINSFTWIWKRKLTSAFSWLNFIIWNSIQSNQCEFKTTKLWKKSIWFQLNWIWFIKKKFNSIKISIKALILV